MSFSFNDATKEIVLTSPHFRRFWGRKKLDGKWLAVFEEYEVEARFAFDGEKVRQTKPRTRVNVVTSVKPIPVDRDADGEGRTSIPIGKAEAG